MAVSSAGISFAPEKRQTIIILQWLIVIATSYLILFTKAGITPDVWIHGVVVFFLATALALYRIPEHLFHHRLFDIGLVLINTILISTAIYLKRDVAWDLFFLYFFVLFIAAIGASMVKIVLGAVVISIVYLAQLLQQGKNLADISADVSLRVFFLLGLSVLYGYLSENANKERLRAETAEQRERFKMDLLSALAHDIKNPLGTIMTYVEMALESLPNRNESKSVSEALERVHHNAQRIVHLLTGFLDASKAQLGKLEVKEQPLHINQIAREVSQHQVADLRKKDLTLKVDLDDSIPEIIGDENQIYRVLWNLVGNAVKFTPKGGTVTISTRSDHRHLSISVKDTGIGIPKEDLPLLFSQFGRLRGAANIEGTGLGLFIVKTIVEAHKGTIEATSNGEKGATFTVRLPIRDKRSSAAYAGLS